MGGLALPIGLPNRVDAAVGNGFERLIVRHHRRRLRRIGRLDALDAPSGGWAVGDLPPRSGSAVEVLVDGAEALPRIAEEIEGARSHVWLAGWFFSPAFRLRAGDGETLRELLAEAAERVDVASSPGPDPRCPSSIRTGASCGRCATSSCAELGSAAPSTPASARSTATTRSSSS